MKRITAGLGLMAACLFFTSAQAQDAPVAPVAPDAQTTENAPGVFYIGARFMPTLSNFDVHQSNGDLYETNATIGFGFGGLIGTSFNDHIGLQAEVIYSALAQEYIDDMNVKRNINLDYLNIPLLFVLNTNSSATVNFNVVLGPQIGILVKSDFETDAGASGDSVTAVFGAKTGDLGFAYGAGIDFNLLPNLSFDIGYRGVIGLLDISDQSQSLETNQYYVLDKSNLKTYAAYVGVKLRF